MAFDRDLALATEKELLEAIKAKATPEQSVQNLLRLAEAYAWVLAPDNGHGGSNATSPK